MTAPLRIPRRVWIGTYEFKVAIVSPTDEVLKSEDFESGFAEGMCDTGDARTIYIPEGLEPRRFLEVVWHETHHAINWVFDVEAKLEGGAGDISTLEEELTDLYGKAWTQFLLDNPRMDSWFHRIAKQIRKEQKDA